MAANKCFLRQVTTYLTNMYLIFKYLGYNKTSKKKAG